VNVEEAFYELVREIRKEMSGDNGKPGGKGGKQPKKKLKGCLIL
jgi:hypothetical protein